jgi:AAA domain-containing protein
MALYVVMGPPASGKTTYVTTRAKPGDIIIDLDRIAAALTAPGADSHQHGDAVKRVAHRIRQGAIAEALRHCAHVDVYIIHSKPRPEARAKYDRHHAQYVTVDPGRDVVLARCAEQRSTQARAAAMRWYDEHTTDSEPTTVSASRTW